MVPCIFRLVEMSVESAFPNQPGLTDLDTFQLAVAKQTPKILQTIAAICGSRLHR